MHPQERISADIQNDEDVSLKNLVGYGASRLAEKWADHNNVMKKLSMMRQHITPEENAIMDVLLGINKPKIGRLILQPSESLADFSRVQTIDKGKGKQVVLSRYEDRESDEDSDNDSGDNHTRAANLYFGHSAEIDPNNKENACWPSSEASQEPELADNNNETTPMKGQGKGHPVPEGIWRQNRLTPRSSPRQLPTPSPRKTIVLDFRDHSKISQPQIPKPTPLTPISNKAKAPSGLSHQSPICIGSSPDNLVKQESSVLPVIDKSAAARRKNLPKSPASAAAPRPDVASQGSATKDIISRDPVSPGIKRKKSSDHALSTSKKPRSGSQKAGRVFIGPAHNQTENSSPPRSQETSSFLSDRNQLHLRRLEMARELSVTYSDLTKPSYEKRRSRQLARLQRKETVQDISMITETNDRMGLSTTTTKPLLLTKTVASFDPVEDDDGGMDWNRSRQLAEAARTDALNGRRVVLPPLQCATSQP